VLITVIFSYGITKLGFDNSVEAFLPQNDSEYLFYNQTKDIYGDNGRFIIMLVSQENLWSREVFKLLFNLIQDLEEYKEYNQERETFRIKRIDELVSKRNIEYSELMDAFQDDAVFLRFLKRKIGKKFVQGKPLVESDLRWIKRETERTNEFKKQKMIDKIISPITARDISGEDDTLDTYDLVPKDENEMRILPESERDFQDLRKKLFRNPAFEKGIYVKNSKTGEITDFGIIVKFTNLKNQDLISREIFQLIQSHDKLKIVIQGAPVVNITFNDYMRRDLIKFLPVVMIVVIIIFFFNFRSIRGVCLPFATLLMSTLWILGLMGYLGFKITAVGISLPALMIAVGSSYAIHILNQYYADFQLITQKGIVKGLRLSMSHISVTVLLAGLTTVVAFMTLSTSQLSAIREWGIFSGIGVIFAIFISCSMIPAGLSLFPHKMPRLLLKKNEAVKITVIDRVITLMISGSTRHYKSVLACVFILILLSIWGLLRLNVESEFTQYFKENDPIRTSAEIIEKKLGGRWGFNILLDSGRTDGVKDPEFLNLIESIRKWLTSDQNRSLNIGRTDAFSDYIKTMNLAMNDDDPSYYNIPERYEDIIDYLEIYSGDDDNSDGRIDEFESYVDHDFKTANLVARLAKKEDYNLGTSQTKRIIETVAKYLQSIVPAPYSFKITGFPVMNIKIAHYVVTGQMNSLLLSLIVIAIIVAVLFNNFKAGFLALIPMSVAVIINFGIMGWFNINLDMVTSIIAAITIGIGVDDTIHFLNTYRYYRKKGYGIDETIEKTLRVSGKAIIYTSLALIFGFSVLTMSSFKPVILFGILMAITMIATTIGALLVLPSVIRFTRVNLMKSQGRIWRFIHIGRFFKMEHKA